VNERWFHGWVNHTQRCSKGNQEKKRGEVDKKETWHDRDRRELEDLKRPKKLQSLKGFQEEGKEVTRVGLVGIRGAMEERGGRMNGRKNYRDTSKGNKGG